jgi:hypothetical protein
MQFMYTKSFFTVFIHLAEISKQLLIGRPWYRNDTSCLRSGVSYILTWSITLSSYPTPVVFSP